VVKGARNFLQFERNQDFGKFADYRSFQQTVVNESHLLVERNPWAPILYLRYRHDPGFIGQAVREVEESYFKEQARAYKHFTKQDADLRAMRLVAYLKIGVLYGLQADSSLWFGPANAVEREKLSIVMADLSQRIMTAAP